MSSTNKILKSFFYVALALYMTLISCIVGILIGGSIFSIILSAWSLIKPLPEIITQKAWLYHVLTGLIMGFVIEVYLIIDVIKTSKKGNNKGN
jgi:hypothetical protein